MGSPKKYVATFEHNGRKKTTAFGARGYQDYTQHHDPERRRRYMARHSRRENWANPTTAGSLSRYVLWGQSASVRANVAAYKRRFGL